MIIYETEKDICGIFDNTVFCGLPEFHRRNYGDNGDSHSLFMVTKFTKIKAK